MSTHLDFKMYTKEQIYSVTKDRVYLLSKMYSLTDFPDVRYEIAKKAIEMFETGFLEKMNPGTYESLAMIHML